MTIAGTWEPLQRIAELDATVEAQARELEKLRALLTWQPIETAPRNVEVLLRVKQRAGIPHKCLVGHYMGGGHCIEDHPPIDAGWYFWNGCMFDRAAEPIEWMPLQERQQLRAALGEKSDA